MNVSILGLGLIGSSLAKAIKNSNPEIKILGFDFHEISKQALELSIIDEKLNSITDAKNSDIIFLCLPIEVTLDFLEIVAPIVKKNAIVTDVCGVKSVLSNKWKNLESKGIFVGGHPMTGKEKGGIENSDPLLFENAVYILTYEDANDKKISPLKELLLSIGAKLRFLSAKKHDEIVAHVSHLPQLISVALVNAALDDFNNDFKEYAAAGFKDLTRIASSDFYIWKFIIKHNKYEILNSLKSFQDLIHKITTCVLSDDLWRLEDLFESAKEKRNEIPKNTKGFINPLHDIFVYVKDEPGAISKLTTLLFENKFDIKEIELLKIREGTGGTFRLSFESEAVAENAKNSLAHYGYKFG